MASQYAKFRYHRQLQIIGQDGTAGYPPKVDMSTANKRTLSGKTAIITADDRGYGMSRMLETLYRLEQMPFEIQVFNNLEEAVEWMGVGRRHDGRDDGQGRLKGYAVHILRLKLNGCGSPRLLPGNPSTFYFSMRPFASRRWNSGNLSQIGEPFYGCFVVKEMPYPKSLDIHARFEHPSSLNPLRCVGDKDGNLFIEVCSVLCALRSKSH